MVELIKLYEKTKEDIQLNLKDLLLDQGINSDKFKKISRFKSFYQLPGYPLFSENRSVLRKYLKKRGVDTLSYKRFWFLVPKEEKKFFQNDLKIYESHLLLPINENISKNDLQQIINLLNEY